MRIGVFTSTLLALQLPPGTGDLLILVTCLIGAIAGVSLSSKLDAIRRHDAGGEG